MNNPKTAQEHDQTSTLRLFPEDASESIQAWEQIEAGRYMPRRTRGSFPGRELG